MHQISSSRAVAKIQPLIGVKNQSATSLAVVKNQCPIIRASLNKHYRKFFIMAKENCKAEIGRLQDILCKKAYNIMVHIRIHVKKKSSIFNAINFQMIIHWIWKRSWTIYLKQLSVAPE